MSEGIATIKQTPVSPSYFLLKIITYELTAHELGNSSTFFFRGKTMELLDS